MKFFVSFVMFFLLLNVFATTQTLIQNSCKQAAAKDPNLKYDFCVKSLQEDPSSRAATAIDGLLVASIKSATFKTNSVKGIAASILKNPRHSHALDVPLRDCLDHYSDAVGSLNDALASAKARDYRTTNVNLSAAFDAPSDCEDAFKEKKQPSPITNDNNALTQKILIPLAFSNMV